MSASRAKPEPVKFGSYLLLRVLGEGGGGTAYLALRENRSGEPLVLKVLGSAAVESTVALERFDHEARLALAADIATVPKVHEVGRVGDTPFIAMELIRGMSLSRLLKKLWKLERRLEVEGALSITRSLLRGLRALHEAKDPEGRPLDAVHRDLSPRNLLIERDGRVRILDLGIGRSNLRAVRTQTGVILGTPGYMSPEQVLGAPLSQRSDVYATGVIFWELLMGRRYVASGELAAVLAATVKRTFEAPSSKRPDVTPLVDAVCKQALAIDPERRYANASEMLSALEEVTELSLRSTEGAALAEVYELDFSDEDLATWLRDDSAPEPATQIANVSEDIAPTIVPTELATPPSVEPPPVITVSPPAAPIAVWLLMVVAVAGAAVLLIGVLLKTEPTNVVQLQKAPLVPEGAPVPPTPGARALPVETPTIAEPEEIPDEDPIADPTPTKQAIKRAPPVRGTTPSPAPSIPQEPTVAELVATFHQRANALKAERPDLRPAIDDLLNALVFESTSVDDAETRARIKRILAQLASLKASGERSAAQRDR
jgi:eukaryotic-like serine/threonine-protein kinase